MRREGWEYDHDHPYNIMCGLWCICGAYINSNIWWMIIGCGCCMLHVASTVTSLLCCGRSDGSIIMNYYYEPAIFERSVERRPCCYSNGCCCSQWISMRASFAIRFVASWLAGHRYSSGSDGFFVTLIRALLLCHDGSLCRRARVYTSSLEKGK